MKLSPAETRQATLETRLRSLLLPDYVAAVRASVLGNEASLPLWRKFEIKLARALLLSTLYGSMDVAHAVRATGRTLETGGPSLVERVRSLRATFATVGDALGGGPDSESLLTIPFAEAVDALRGRIPGLIDIVDQNIGEAAQAASQIRGMEEARGVAQAREMLTEVVGAGRPITMGVFMDNLEAITGRSRANLETIYRTNLNAAFNEGRFRQLQRTSPEVFPLYMLIERRDDRTRGKPGGKYPRSKGYSPHFQMGGYVARRDDPIWLTIWPPNGFNCRATVRGLTTFAARGMGFVNKDGTISDGRIRQHNGNRSRFLASGEYPDKGFKSAGMGMAA